MSAETPVDFRLPEVPYKLLYFTVTLGEFYDGLRLLAAFHQRNTNLVLQELQRMATNDAQLTTEVTAVATAVTNLIGAYDAETASLQTQITALQNSANANDPAVDAAITALKATLSNLNDATAAAQAAITTAPTANPTPAAASPSSSPASTTEPAGS